ncbi:MamE containing serine protease Do [Gammaproteobacteria bacterium]
MFFKRSECGLEMRKYLYWIGILALLTLVGSYWYLNYFLDEIGLDTPEYRILPPPHGAGPFATGPNPLPIQPVITAAPVAWPTGVMAPPVMGEPSFASVVRDILPAVVNVSTQNTLGPRQNPNPANQPAAGEGTMKFASPYSGIAWESIGSGVVVTADGYVVSNYHVVETSRNVFVTVFGTLGNQRYSADVIQTDPARDLVLLKIKATQPLQVAPLGNSDELQVGEPVITVGCPFGLDQTVSKGIVSGLRKMVTIESVVHSNLIQTDAAINQGNSGGPLVSATGQVVGINTAIYSPTQAFSGVGFAVPSNTVRDFLNELLVLPEGVGGFSFPLTSTVAAQRNLPPAISATAVPPHPDRGACQNCHQIIRNGVVASQPVAAQRPFAPPIPANSIAPHPDRGTCESCHQIIRNGQLVAQYSQPLMSSPMMSATGRNVALPPDTLLGATLKPVDAYLIQRFRPPFDGGVFVVRVEPSSISAQGGLAGGDIIFKINGRWVRNPEELQAYLSGLSVGDRIRLGVMRNRERKELLITLTEQAAAQPVAGMGFGPGFGQGLGLGRGFGPGFGPGGCAARPVAYPCPAATQTVAAVTPTPMVETPVMSTQPRQAASPAPKTPVKTEFEWLGMELQPVTAAMVTKDPTLKDKSGALVQDTDPGLQADKAGVKTNDLVLAINGLPVSSNVELDKAITATSQANTILLDVDRGGQRMLVTLK